MTDTDRIEQAKSQLARWLAYLAGSCAVLALAWLYVRFRRPSPAELASLNGNGAHDQVNVGVDVAAQPQE